MMKFELNGIGIVNRGDEGFEIQLDPEFREALTGLEGFSWVNIIWWANQLDDAKYRTILSTDKPYKKGPEKLGIFATRSPVRPNPIMLTAVYISRIDFEAGILYTPYIDTEDGSPVLDIKPYHGSTDRVENWSVPQWCEHWPKTIEESAEFAWEEEFNF